MRYFQKVFSIEFMEWVFTLDLGYFICLFGNLHGF